MASYTFDLFEKTQKNSKKVARQMIYSPTLDWKPMKADFDTEYTEMKKEKNSHYYLSYYSKFTPC